MVCVRVVLPHNQGSTIILNNHRHRDKVMVSKNSGLFVPCGCVHVHVCVCRMFDVDVEVSRTSFWVTNFKNSPCFFFSNTRCRPPHM